MEKITVEFKFELDQGVIDPFDEPCIIKMLGIDNEGICYFVLRDVDSRWYREYELVPFVKDEDECDGN